MRPTKYNEEVAERILRLVMEHGSLRKAMEAADDLPSERSVYRWLAENEEFRHRYAHAREAGDEPMADELERIAYDAALPSDQKRVMADTIKWLLARRSPKKWGDKMQHTGDGGGPVQFTVVTGLPDADGND